MKQPTARADEGDEQSQNMQRLQAFNYKQEMKQENNHLFFLYIERRERKSVCVQ